MSNLARVLISVFLLVIFSAFGFMFYSGKHITYSFEEKPVINVFKIDHSGIRFNYTEEEGRDVLELKVFKYHRKDSSSLDKIYLPKDSTLLVKIKRSYDPHFPQEDYLRDEFISYRYVPR